MIQRVLSLSSAIALPGAIPRPAIPFRALALRRWLAAHRELAWLAAILLVAAFAHGINMSHFPYYEDDEGTYMSQAWAVVHLGQLAPYTYWYDHAPGGWIQIALWSMLTGGFHTFGQSVESGRMLMLCCQVISTGLLYGIARRLSGSVTVASVAALLFIFSAYGGYFHRRVLLDNITTPWMLFSIFLLIAPRLSLRGVWLSGVALGISILSKELTIFLIPAMIYLIWYRAHPGMRLFALSGWASIVGSIVSLYVLMAILKGELFAQGTLLGGKAPHVSLLGTLQYQASRGNDGGPRNLHSAFWQVVGGWVRDEPLLTAGGTLCALLSVAVIRRHRLIGIMGLLTLSLWAFVSRGGVIIEFYLVPLLPLLALNIALVFGLIAGLVQSALRVPLAGRPRLGRGLKLAAAALCVSGIGAGYFSPDRGFAGNHLLLWTSTQADAQNQALAWVEAHLSPKSRIIMDNYAYTDLHDGSDGTAPYTLSHYYWKLDQDPAIGGTLFHQHWWNVDYVLSTIQLLSDVNQAHLLLTGELIDHSVTLARFDTGGWPVEVRQVIKPGQHAPVFTAPVSTTYRFAGGINTASARTELDLQNPQILPASVQLTFRFADGTVDSQSVDIDASSVRAVQVSDIEQHSGSFSLVIRSDRPIAAHLLLRRAQASPVTLGGAAPPTVRTAGSAAGGIPIANPVRTFPVSLAPTCAAPIGVATLARRCQSSGLPSTSGVGRAGHLPVAVAGRGAIVDWMPGEDESPLPGATHMDPAQIDSPSQHRTFASSSQAPYGAVAASGHGSGW